MKDKKKVIKKKTLILKPLIHVKSHSLQFLIMISATLTTITIIIINTIFTLLFWLLLLLFLWLLLLLFFFFFLLLSLPLLLLFFFFFIFTSAFSCQSVTTLCETLPPLLSRVSFEVVKDMYGFTLKPHNYHDLEHSHALQPWNSQH